MVPTEKLPQAPIASYFSNCEKYQFPFGNFKLKEYVEWLLSAHDTIKILCGFGFMQ